MIIESAYVPPDHWDPDVWPYTVPCVRQVCDEGLRFSAPVTMLVGENGSGKSTLAEGLAEAYGLDVRGGHGNRQYGVAEPKGIFGSALRVQPGRVLARGFKRGSGFFLRAETAFGVLAFMSDHGVAGYGENTVSHGESYLQVLEGRFGQLGLFILDEPETPLSFDSCLVLMRTLYDAAAAGSQVICATHSPLLAALPGATILEIGDHGIRPVAWGDLEMVDHWRRYLHDPQIYLRHVLEP